MQPLAQICALTRTEEGFEIKKFKKATNCEQYS